MLKRISFAGTGIAAVAMMTAFASAACGGDDSPPEEEATGGGSNNTGGSASGTGGDGAGGGSAGAATGGTAGESAGIACSHTVPPDERITDFSLWAAGEWGDPNATLTGGSFDYGAEGYTLDMTVTDEVLNVTASVPAEQYAGFGFWFGPCTDASGYSGISFTLGGDAGSAEIVFQVQTSKNYPIVTTPGEEKGECEGSWGEGCASNEVVVEILEGGGTVSVAWGDLSNGQPETSVTPSELLGIQWQLNCGSDGTGTDGACELNITLDDVQFML